MANTTISRPGGYLLLADGSQLPLAGDVTVSSEVERVRTAMASKPDERWTHTDSHGHVHKYVRDEEDVPRLPSLERRIRQEECDGSCYSITHGDCEGYAVTEWFCRECGDEVEPGFKHDYEAENPGIPISVTTEYALSVEMEPPTGMVQAAAPILGPIKDAIYVHTDAAGVEHRYPLPILQAGSYEVESGFDRPLMRAQLQGTEWKRITRKPIGP